jgi:hypothetical protein
VNDAPARQYLTRKEAAIYLNNKWFRISAATLARYACDKIGPPFRQTGKQQMGPVLYLVTDLDKWAQSFPVVNHDDDQDRPVTLAPAQAKAGALGAQTVQRR